MAKYTAAKIREAQVMIFREMGYTPEQRMKSAYWNTEHPGHQMAVDEMFECHRIVAGDAVLDTIGEGGVEVELGRGDGPQAGNFIDPNKRTSSDGEIVYDTRN